MHWTERTYWENTTQEYLVALGILTAVVLLTLLFKWLMRRRVRKSEQTPKAFEELIRRLIERLQVVFVFLIALYLVSRTLVMPEIALRVMRAVAIIVALVQAGIWMSVAIDYFLRKYREDKIDTDAASVTTVSAIAFIGKAGLWLILFLVALDNFGVEITALITGLGIGGIAVALALQNVLGDLFASLAIVVDKPFVIGDFIIVGDYIGSVEKIGLKTTRIRSLGGEQIIMGNSDLLSSRIRNYKRMNERRIVYTFGVDYRTSAEKLERVPQIIRETIESMERVRFDRSHVKGFGDSAFQIETVFWILSPEYNVYMDIQQKLSLTLVDAFQREGIRFAFPVRHLMQENPGAEAVIRS